jgi:selenocysteine-specific elongation factor
MWIDRSFAAHGSGTVVTGTLTDGSLAVDQQVLADGRSVRIRSIQTLGESVDRIEPGRRTALNLVGVDHHLLARGDAVVVDGQWHLTRRVDAELRVLGSLGHVVGRRGAYAAYVGAGEWPVRLRVLGSESIPPGGHGAVRLHLPADLPLLPGDRFVLRERGRDETVGGGEILDVDPVLPASRARPDRSVERVVRERGWVQVDALERLTGVHVGPVVGSWVVDPDELAATRAALEDEIAAAGPRGLELAALDERRRALAEALAAGPDAALTIEAGRATHAGTVDPMADHPVLALLAAGGVAPPEPTGVPRGDLRELQRRGLLVERDDIWFHVSAIDHAARTAARVLADRPDGFTLAELRDALGVTRKFAVPLASELDARGVTRRRGDLRIAGPRCPAVD